MQKGCNHISTLQSDQESTGLFQNCLKESLFPPSLRTPPPPPPLPSGQGQAVKKKKKKLSQVISLIVIWLELFYTTLTM